MSFFDNVGFGEVIGGIGVLAAAGTGLYAALQQGKSSSKTVYVPAPIVPEVAPAPPAPVAVAAPAPAGMPTWAKVLIGIAVTGLVVGGVVYLKR